MKPRLAIVLLALLLGCLPAASAMGSVMTVNDTAAVLSRELINQADQLDQLLQRELGLGFQVITKHFLGGADAQAYAEEALAQREDLAVLLVVVGEERYALALGQDVKAVLSSEKANSLLLKHFRTPFLISRDYDRAVAGMLLALSEQMQYAKGRSLTANDLLLSYVDQQPPRQAVTPSPITPTRGPEGMGGWLDSIFADWEESENYATQYHDEADMARRGTPKGLSIFQIALIGYVLYRIFGRSSNGRKKGCGPLGWIFGTWGASKFFGWRK